jgi:hypothetical protein
MPCSVHREPNDFVSCLRREQKENSSLLSKANVQNEQFRGVTQRSGKFTLFQPPHSA